LFASCLRLLAVEVVHDGLPPLAVAVAAAAAAAAALGAHATATKAAAAPTVEATQHRVGASSGALYCVVGSAFAIHWAAAAAAAAAAAQVEYRQWNAAALNDRSIVPEQVLAPCAAAAAADE